MEYLLCKSQMHSGKWQSTYLVQSRCQWCNFKHQSKYCNGKLEYFSGANVIEKSTSLFLWWNSPQLHHKCLGALFESCWRHLPVWSFSSSGCPEFCFGTCPEEFKQPDSYLPPKKLGIPLLKSPGGLKPADILKKHQTHTQKTPWKMFCGCFFRTDSGGGSATHLSDNTLWLSHLLRKLDSDSTLCSDWRGWNQRFSKENVVPRGDTV